MFIFDKEDVYIGYSLDELFKVRDILEKEGIKYIYKVVNHSGLWLGRGTRRGKLGSFGMNMEYLKQYIVSVKRYDFKKAQQLVNSVLCK